MSHHHFCDVGGHQWACSGEAPRPGGDHSEASVYMCIAHQVPMEEGDHSACPVELLACPDHRNSERGADDSSMAPDSSFADLFGDIFTPESREKSECERRVVRRLVFFDLVHIDLMPCYGIGDNLEADFLKAVARCELLKFNIHGIDFLTTQGAYLGTEICPENESGAAWCREAMRLHTGPDVVYSASYGVPEDFLALFNEEEPSGRQYEGVRSIEENEAEQHAACWRFLFR